LSKETYSPSKASEYSKPINNYIDTRKRTQLQHKNLSDEKGRTNEDYDTNKHILSNFQLSK